MRPTAKCNRAQGICQQYLDVLTVHTHGRNIPTVGKGFFERRLFGGVVQTKMNMTIPH